MNLIVILFIFVLEIAFGNSHFLIHSSNNHYNNVQLLRMRRNIEKFLEKPQGNKNVSSDIYALLVEIKELMLSKSSVSNNWQKEFDKFDTKMQSSINNFQNQIDYFSKSSNQKVDILQQAFIGIGSHMTSESRTLSDTRTRVTLAEERILHLERNAKEEFKVDSIQENETVRTESSLTPINSNLIVDNLSASVPESPLIISWRSDSKTPPGEEKSSADENDSADTLALGDILKNLAIEISNLKANISQQSLLISQTRDKKVSQDYLASICNMTESCSNPENFKTQITNLEEDLKVLKHNHESLWVSSNNSFVDSAQILAEMKIKSDYLENKILSMESLISELMTSTSEISKDRMEITALREKIELLEKSLHASLEMATNNFQNRQIMESNVKRVLCVWPYIRRAGSCYYISQDKRMKWEEARKHCQDMQGDLAAPKDFEIFRQFLSDQKLSRSYTYWIGGSDAAAEDDWKWVDGRKIAMGHELWATDQPNEGKSSNCMGLRLSSRVIAAIDDDCFLSNYFICEQDQNE